MNEIAKIFQAIQAKTKEIERRNERIVELQKQVTILESEIAIFEQMLEEGGDQ